MLSGKFVEFVEVKFYDGGNAVDIYAFLRSPNLFRVSKVTGLLEVDMAGSWQAVPVNKLVTNSGLFFDSEADFLSKYYKVSD